MKLTDDINKLINDLDCSFRFVYVSPTYTEHPTTGKPVVDNSEGIRKPGVYCHIIDKATKETYAQGYALGSDENGALMDGLEKAKTAVKPLTPAQKFTRDQVFQAVADKDAEIAELRAKLAALEVPKPERKKPGPKPREPESVSENV